MDVVALELAAEDLKVMTPFPVWSGVRYYHDDQEIAFAGDKSGRVLEIDCPWATQQMAEDLLENLQGQTYQPFAAPNAILPPEAELGDTVIVGDIHAQIANISTDLDGLCAADISAPEDEALNHKYPYTSPAEAAWKRAQRNLANITVGMDSIKLEVENNDATIRSLISQTAGEIRAEAENTTQQLRSEIDLIPGRITLQVTNDADGKHASITLLVDGNPYSVGKILLDGNVDVSGTLSAQALYAQLGDIAHLTVDSLSTSRRIAKYLAHDTSDDLFIRIQGVNNEYVAGIYAGSSEQATDPFQALLYWEDDPNGADVTLGPTGYPYKDNVPIYTTTTETPWPIYVYTYREQVKAKWGFEENISASGAVAYEPEITLGAGNAQGRNIAHIRKGLDGLEILYLSNVNREIGIKATADGYLDLYGPRRTLEMDFSNFDNGSFTETLEGETTPHVYRVVRDQQLRPVRIYDESGFYTTIKW